ncbi:MAG: metal ABC transporter substrate-binding protein [Actinomycetota bacterium]|nr:metal ABC transporter substrate-binding protein [Actinomycetota bacterium]
MLRLPLLLAGLLLAAACGGRGEAASSGPRVIAAFYPLAFVAQEVTGSAASVTNLSPPGVEPHDLELAPDQVRALSEADLVIYLGAGFQPAVEDIVGDLDETATLDVLEDQEDLLADDPHVWLDPLRLGEIADSVAARLAQVDPGDAQTYEDNAGALTEELERLDEDFAGALMDCERDELVVSHEAFGYLTNRYGLEQVGVSGVDPELEPSPGRLAEVAEFARANGVTTIFFEEQVSGDIAEVLAEESGAATEVLDPLEFPPDGPSDYFDVMRNNLTAITTALGCAR